MTTDEYVPSIQSVRDGYVWLSAEDNPVGRELAGEDFDRFLAHVRRDAVRQFIAACKAKRDEPGFLLPSNYWQDIEAAIRVAESYVKNHPEESL